MQKKELPYFLIRFPEQIQESLRLNKFKVKDINKILICGMGGSAIPGDVLQDYIKNIPVFVSKGYDIPEFVDKKTLVFVISYSGNTEETLAMYEKAKKKNLKIIAITTNGKLSKICKDCIIIPRGLEPRYAIAYLFFPLLDLLQKSKLIKNQNKNIKATINLLKKFDFNKPKELAKKLKNKTIILYGSDNYRAALENFKIMLNETCKQFAFYNTFSEIDHNEIEAYSKLKKDFSVIIFRDKKDLSKIKKRIEITEQIIKRSANIHEVFIKGNNNLARIFYAIYFGNILSYELALIKKVNPLQTSLIEKLKIRLKT